MDVLLARQLRKRPSAPRRVSANGAPAGRPLIEPFQVLFEADGLPRYELPQELFEIYGALGFGSEVLYSNFVASLDGVAALGSEPSAGSILSGRNPADRFLMGLLRACADAVLLGAGTLRATPGHRWTAEHVFPAMAASFAQLRQGLGRKPKPRLVVFSASGMIDLNHPAVVEGATLVTTGHGAKALTGMVPSSCDVIALGKDDRVDPVRAVSELRRRGYSVLLTEGGPNLMGELVRADLLDELFITIAPVLAGRDKEARHGMVAGVELLPDHQVLSRLLSARRNADFLFLRYSLRN